MRWYLFGLVSWLASPAAAGVGEEFAGVRSAAMGGAHRGLGTSNDTLYLNPAGMSLASRYAVELDYRFSNFDELYRLAATVVDSKSGPVAGGLGYTYVWGDENGLDPALHRVVLALSYPITPAVAVGVSSRHIRGSLVTGLDREEISLYSGDLALSLRPAQGVGLAVSAHNLVKTDLPELTPLTFGAGLAYDASPLAVACDVAVNAEDASERKVSYHVGGEYFLRGEFPLRAGYRRAPFIRKNGNEANEDQLTGGLGWITPGGALGITYEHSLTRARNWSVTAGLGFFL